MFVFGQLCKQLISDVRNVPPQQSPQRGCCRLVVTFARVPQSVSFNTLHEFQNCRHFILALYASRPHASHGLLVATRKVPVKVLFVFDFCSSSQPTFDVKIGWYIAARAHDVPRTVGHVENPRNDAAAEGASKYVERNSSES